MGLGVRFGTWLASLLLCANPLKPLGSISVKSRRLLRSADTRKNEKTAASKRKDRSSLGGRRKLQNKRRLEEEAKEIKDQIEASPDDFIPVEYLDDIPGIEKSCSNSDEKPFFFFPKDNLFGSETESLDEWTEDDIPNKCKHR